MTSPETKNTGNQGIASFETYQKGFSKARMQFANEDLLKQRAFYARNKALEHLDKYLLDFEGHLNKNQGKILWAPNAEIGKNELLSSSEVSGRVLTHSHRLLSELGLMHHAPANWTFFDKGNEAGTADLPGANDCTILFPEFYISENGYVVLATNEPMVQKSLNSCGKVIFVLGLEQICINMTDSELLMSLLSTYKWGTEDHSQYIYTSGSSVMREMQGPKEIQVLILDNGRTDLLAEIPQRQALYCIHCGACERNSNRVALHPENNVSPIEAIKAPWVRDFMKNSGMSFEFPLSGRSTSLCPVNINVKNLLLENRKQAIERKSPSRSDHLAWVAWKTAMLSRKWLNKGSTLKNFTLKSFFKRQYGENREFPKITEKSFNEWWVETRGKNEI